MHTVTSETIVELELQVECWVRMMLSITQGDYYKVFAAARAPLGAPAVGVFPDRAPAAGQS